MRNTVIFAHALFDFVSHYLFVLTLAMKMRDANYKVSLKYFSILRPIKTYVRFEYVLWKMSDFVSLSLFRFTLVTTLGNFDFESH